MFVLLMDSSRLMIRLIAILYIQNSPVELLEPLFLLMVCPI